MLRDEVPIPIDGMGMRTMHVLKSMAGAENGCGAV